MRRRSIRLGFLGAFLIALSALLAPVATADDVRLEIGSVSASATQVTVTGTLMDGDKPVKQQEVIAHVDGAEVGRSGTRGNGAFTISANLGTPLAPGRHTVMVRFNGRGQAGPAATASDFTIGGDEGDAPQAAPEVPVADESSTPAAPATSAPPAPTFTITVGGPEDAHNGEVVELSGKVVDGEGNPAAGVGVSVGDESGEVADSYTLTNDSGGFSTWYSIPEDQPDGELRLTVQVDGSDASSRLSIPISFMELEEEQASEPPAESAEPTPTADSEPQAPAASRSSTEEAEAPAASGTVEAQAGAGPMTVFFAALIGVSAVAVVVLTVMVARAVFGRRRRGSSVALAILDDEELIEGPEDGDEPTQRYEPVEEELELAQPTESYSVDDEWLRRPDAPVDATTDVPSEPTPLAGSGPSRRYSEGARGDAPAQDDPAPFEAPPRPRRGLPAD